VKAGASPLRARCADERGFTIAELVIGASLMLFIFGGAVSLMTIGMRNEPRVAERTADIQTGRVAMENITRELRQGSVVSSATSNVLAVVTNVKSATCGGVSAEESRPCLVTYSCDDGRCTRTERNPDGSGTSAPEVVVAGIADKPVFTYSPGAASPVLVRVRLEFPSTENEDSITLYDAVTMRNAAVPAT
jgi:Tfp pilus assembly protein PilW